jgi:hypothetical protein
MELRPFPAHAHGAVVEEPPALALGEPQRGSAMDLREVLNPSTVAVSMGSSAMETMEHIDTMSSERGGSGCTTPAVARG